MSGDFETLEINQPKITYLKSDDNTEWFDKLILRILWGVNSFQPLFYLTTKNPIITCFSYPQYF